MTTRRSSAAIRLASAGGILSLAAFVAPAPLLAQQSQAAAVGQCDPLEDLTGTRGDLRTRIVSIDQALTYPAATPAQLETLQAQALLTEAAVSRYDVWKKAFDTFKAKDAAAKAAEVYLAALDNVVGTVEGNEADAARALREDQRKAVDRLVADRVTAHAAACSAAGELKRHHAVAMAMKVPPVPAPPAEDRNAPAILARASCIEGIENPNPRVSFATCLVAPYPKSEASSVAVPDRPLRPRGFTAAFTGSKSDAELSLQFANEHKLRSFGTTAGQRFATWGYSLGVAVDGGTLLDLDQDGVRNIEEFSSGFDRINAKTKLTGSLSYNAYPWESAAEFASRAAKVNDKVYAACIKDRAAEQSMASCVGEDLRLWLLQRDADGVQKNKALADEYFGLYFGSGKGVTNARWGAIASGSLARPKLTYKLFDPLGVLGSEIDDRHWNWTLGASGYYRFDLTDATDLTGIISLTYKNNWRNYFASDETFDATQLPIREEGFAPALELRFLWRGGTYWPATALLPKLTLDFSSDRDSVEIPLLFLFGEKMDSSAGLKFTRKWNGTYDDGPDLPSTSEVALIYQKTFSLIPK